LPRTLLALASIACGTDDGSPNSPTDDTEDTDLPADTDIETPPCVDAILVTYAEGGCLGYPDQWEFKVDNAGCATSAVLALWDTVALDWDEEHPLTIGSEAPNGEDWQNWILGPLPHATPEGEWAAGVNTSFDCVGQAESVTTATRLFDGNGAVVACAIWGHDPAAVVSGAASFLHTSAADYAGCDVRVF
jgi:hypothetical protein